MHYLATDKNVFISPIIFCIEDSKESIFKSIFNDRFPWLGKVDFGLEFKLFKF